jgi:hypothetical protein
MLQILWDKKRKVKMGQTKVHDLVIIRKYYITLEGPEAELTSVIERFEVPLYAVDLQESPTVNNNLPKVSKYNNIVIDVLFYMKCQLKTHTHIHTPLAFMCSRSVSKLSLHKHT